MNEELQVQHGSQRAQFMSRRRWSSITLPTLLSWSWISALGISTVRLITRRTNAAEWPERRLEKVASRLDAKRGNPARSVSEAFGLAARKKAVSGFTDTLRRGGHAARTASFSETRSDREAPTCVTKARCRSRNSV